MMTTVVYKSEYSKVCDMVGHPKPKTQEEEDYCQIVELEHPETAKKCIERMKIKNKL